MTTAEDVVAKAVALFEAHVPRLLSDVDRTLPLYDRIPVRINALDVLAVGSGEDAHTELLAWLLDPTESHDLGDAFLRRFLLLARTRAAADAALHEAPLRAIVRTQLDVPSFGTPDLVITLDAPRTVVVVEAKIDAGLTIDEEGAPQTLRYRRAIAAGAMQRALRLEKPDQTTFVLVFLHAQRGQLANDEDPDKETETGLGVPHFLPVLYREVERALAEVAGATDVDPIAHAIVGSFRSSILTNAAGTDDPISALRRLRLARSRRESAAWSATETVAQLARDLEVLSGKAVTTMENDDPEMEKLVLAHAATVAMMTDALANARAKLLKAVVDTAESSDALRAFNGKRVDYEVAGPGKRWGLGKPDGKTITAVQVALEKESDGSIGFSIRTSIYDAAVGGTGARKALPRECALALPDQATDDASQPNGLWTRVARDTDPTRAVEQAKSTVMQELATAQKIYDAVTRKE